MELNKNGFIEPASENMETSKIAHIAGTIIGAGASMMSPNATITSRVITVLGAAKSIESTCKKKSRGNESVITEAASGVIGMAILGNLSNFLFGK